MATALQELLAKRRAQEAASATPLGIGEELTSDPDEDAAESGVVPGAEASDDAMPVSEPDEKDTPYGVAQVVTPSGLEIYFQAGPKRLYKLREAIQGDADGTPYEDESWTFVPSMSDVKDILDKPALSWWGMKIGVAGVCELRDLEAEWYGQALVEKDIDWIVSKLTQHKLTVNHQRDKAAARGTSVHKALEAWAEKGTMPIPDVYPEHERGYVQGVVDFLTDSGAEPLASEVMVGSLEWGFAGRFDLVAQIPNNAEVYVHRTEKGRGDRIEKVPGGRWLLDLKTSKDVYPSHHLQCAGYELAYRESYWDETDAQGVIQVPEDGRYKLVQSRATVDHFQNIKSAYDSLKQIG